MNERTALATAPFSHEVIEACDFVLASDATAENAKAQKAAAELKTELQREKT